MSQHLFKYVPNSKTVYDSKYLRECELLVLSEVSNWAWWNCRTSKCREQYGNRRNKWLRVRRRYRSSWSHIWVQRIHSFVAVITFTLYKPVYIIEVTEKGRATQMMSGINGHSISKGGLYLRGIYLKVVRSKNMLLKKF